MRYYRGLLLFTAILLSLSGIIPSSAKDQVKSNLDVAAELTATVSKEIISRFPSSVSERGVLLAPHGKDEIYQFITNILTETIASSGFTVYSRLQSYVNSQGDTTAPVTAPVTAPGNGLRMEYQALEFSIQYPKIFRSHLIGGKRVKRRAEVELFAKIVNPDDGAVVWAGEVGRSYEDQFPFALISEVEKGLFAFTKPERASTKWSRIIEPMAVSGIIVGLIYLFFSNQSGD